MSETSPQSQTPSKQAPEEECLTITVEDEVPESLFKSIPLLSDPERLWNGFLIVVNIIASTAVVIVNKWIFNEDGFKFATLLTVIHFFATYLALEWAASIGMFEKKWIKPLDMAPICTAFCGFVVLTNLSLQYNSVSFYQCAKILTTPGIAGLQYYIYGTEFSKNIKISLSVICIGVFIASVSDLELNLVGTIIALVAVLVSSLYQVWVGGKQKEFDVNAWQLLHNQAPLSALGLIFFVPLFDNVPKLLQTQVTVSLIWHILLSILAAIILNLSTFMVIGRTSAVTYNVSGHLKTVLVLLFGFLVFQYPLVFKNLIGILVTLTGVGLYSKFKLEEQAT